MLNTSNCPSCNDDGEIMIITAHIFVDSDADKSVYAQPQSECGLCIYYQIRKVIIWKSNNV